MSAIVMLPGEGKSVRLGGSGVGMEPMAGLARL
jgi:hypothetical protein